MTTHEIWAEGFPKPDGHAKAALYATVEADSFSEACNKLVESDEMFCKHFDKRDHTFVGCKIFSSEEKARRRFG